MIETRRLVEQARRGDAGAFERLVREFYRAAYATAVARTGNAMDAEDVVQESFMTALERLDECDPDRFGAWLLTIVRNRAHNVRERERVRAAEPIDTVTPASSERTDRAVQQHELGAALTKALATLPEAQRDVVLLHDLEGWKHREIAKSLGISEVMARQHLFQARKALRAALGGPEMKEYLHG
jgi:RNA polymerase sigma-70 factor (ECF subfamily)